MKSLKTLALASLLITLSGCSVANRLVYRIDINQGNYIDQSVVQELRFGMTKEQVQYVLGPPTISDSSQPNVWYYVHWLKPGHDAPEQKTLILDFDANEKVSNLRGDFSTDEKFFEIYTG